MERAVLDSVTLEYEVVGEGEPVILIHRSFIADAFHPILSEPSLAGAYRLIAYHRRGYIGSTRPAQVLGIPDQAADCRALLRHLRIRQAHVVGWVTLFGGVIALQLALDVAEMIGRAA